MLLLILLLVQFTNHMRRTQRLPRQHHRRQLQPQHPQIKISIKKTYGVFEKRRKSTFSSLDKKYNNLPYSNKMEIISKMN